MKQLNLHGERGQNDIESWACICSKWGIIKECYILCSTYWKAKWIYWWFKEM